MITRTVDAIIETDDGDWVVQTAKTFDASTFDTAVGSLLVRDQLYRLDTELESGNTILTLVFNTVPWELDVDAVPAALDQVTTYSGQIEISVFAGRNGEFQRLFD